MTEETKDKLDNVIQTVISFYGRKDVAHNFEHALRVKMWSEKLALEEGADLIVVELAALLHDIGRQGTVEKTHAESSAGLAVNILQKCGYPEKIVYAVKECVITHSREAGYQPETIEAKIIYDADKLDFVGPIGLVRLFSIAGSEGWPLFGKDSCEQFYQEKIIRYGENLHTNTARRYFAPLIGYMEDFWQKLKTQMA